MTELSFVSDLYRNVLFREPDTAGANYWVNQLTLGGVSRDTVRAAFLNSPEADLYVNPIIRLYENILGRAPDAAGLNAWSQALRGGSQSLAQITAGFLNSTEGQAAGWSGPGVTGQAFITKLYTAMGRTAEQVAADPGATAWAIALNEGRISPANVAIGINESAENKASSAGFVSGYEALRSYGITNPTTAQAQAFSNSATTAQILSSASTVTGSALPTGAGVTPATGGTVGQTFTLTTGADSLTGTANNDTFNGTEATLSAADVLRGGEGRDTLNYTDSSVGGTNLPAADVSGIEVINVRNVGTGTAATREVATFTFGAVANGETLTITPFGGAAVTFPNPGVAGATGAAVAAFFAQTANLPAGYEFVSLNGNQLVLRAVATGNAPNLTLGGAAAPASAVIIQQGAAVGAVAVNTFSAANFVGATDFNTNQSLGAVTVNDLAAGQSLGMIGNGSVTVGALTGAYGATVTSTTLNLSGGLQTAVVAGAPVGAGAVNITGAGLTTANVNSSGAANAVADLDFGGGAALTTLNIKADSAFALATGGSISGFSAGQTSTINVTGAGAVRVNALDAALDVYNASTATGAQTLSLGAATQQVTTGAGNDVVTTNSIELTTGSVNAGAGTADRLVVSASADVSTAAEGARYSGFEQVQLGGTTDITLDLALLAGTNTIDTVRLNNTTGAVALQNMTAVQAANLQITNAASGLITLGLVRAGDAGQIDTVKVALTTTTAAGAAQNIDLATNPISLAGIEKLELTGNGTSAPVTGTVSLDTGAAISLDSIKLSNAGNGNVITIAAGHAATNLVVDASGSTGNTKIDAGAYNTLTGATLRGGSGNDELVASARVDVLTGGTGRDLFNFNAGTSTPAATDRITDIGLVTTAIADVTTLTALVFRDAGEVRGGANADLIDISATAAARATVVSTATNVAAASGNAALDITATLNARGLVTLAGADAGQIDTVAEATAVFNLLNTAAGGTGIFRLGSNSYLIQETAADTNRIVELTGATVTGISIVGAAGTALVGEVFVV